MNENEKAIFQKLEKVQNHFELSNVKFEKLENQISQLHQELSQIKALINKILN